MLFHIKKENNALLKTISADEKSFSVSLKNQSGSSVSFNPSCDYIYIDTHGFIPGEKDAAQITFSTTRSYYDENGVLYNKVSEGVSYAARQEGDASQNTLIHELGHTFGLNDLYIDENDPSVPSCLLKDQYGFYTLLNTTELPDGNIRNYYESRQCDFVTREADVMNYRVPTGPKLRYRPLPTVETGTNKKTEKYDSQWECIQNAVCGGMQ